MSKIFELFGYPLTASDAEVTESRRHARCPFMVKECDGGGNRYASALHLKEGDELFEYFRRKSTVQAGVCSLLIGDKPWIVCPRRLLTLHGDRLSLLQDDIRKRIVRYGNLSPKGEYRIWSEVKMTVRTTSKGGEKRLFNYTFDYVIANETAMPMSKVMAIMQVSETECRRIAERNGFSVVRRDGGEWIDDWPSPPVVIVEVMSSSTSGGNKKKRTQITMAFEDAILNGDQHQGPGINYRQVWARMASQLIVKSQVATKWNAKTIWVLQDVLADYISSTTGLDLAEYAAEHSNEVNILAVGYNEPADIDSDKILGVGADRFYSGPISTGAEVKGKGGFVDIIKVGNVPPIDRLWRTLFRKRPCGILRSPLCQQLGDRKRERD